MCVSVTSEGSRKSIRARADGKAQAVAAAQDEASAATAQRSIAARALIVVINGYRLVISPWIGPRCRFLPTCSDYALDALAQYGAIRGGWLTVRRLARCHPFGGSGFDPVPDEDTTKRNGHWSTCSRYE